MPLPAWLDDELHERRWPLLLALGLAVVAGVVISWMALSSPDAPPPQPVAVVSPPPPRAPVPVAAPVVEAPASARAALPTCPHQALDITDASRGATERGCVSSTRTHVTGSIRSHVVSAEGVSAWSATVDAVAGEVVSVRLRHGVVGNAPERWYACDGADCHGARLGATDAHGASVLTLADVPLQALPVGQRWRRPMPGSRHQPASAPAMPAVTLTAALRIEPDALTPALACAVPGVTVVDGQGAVAELCPRGGAGFEIADSGQTRFLFRDLDGRELAVALDRDHAVAAVELAGLACRAPLCGGVAMHAHGDPADPSVERSFAFSGTTLWSPKAGERSATLTGSVTMPAQ